jgi:hypothetical protein
MDRVKYVIAGLIGLGLIVLVFALIIRGFSGGGTSTGEKPLDLPSYAATDAVAELDIQGPIVLDQNYRVVRIQVAQTLTRIEIIKGYQNTVIERQSFENNETAYFNFLRALQLQGYTNGNSDPAQADETGYCPQGNRFVYRFSEDDVDLMRFWSTTCGDGTFSGDRSQVRQLFIRQIPPDVYNRLTRGIPIG